MKNTISAITILFLFTINISAQKQNVEFKNQTITTEELSKWTFLGRGEVSTWGNQTSIKEADDTKGVMLISPEKYSNDITIRYKALALTPATVIVTMLSVSDEGKSDELTIPNNYDGSIGLWMNSKENYFFAFKNAPHDKTPFVQKNPNAQKPLIEAKENLMVAGIYYDIEVGKTRGKLWLSIDGNKVFETLDTNPLAGGHVAIRLRGTTGYSAGCLIKDLIISSK